MSVQNIFQNPFAPVKLILVNDTEEIKSFNIAKEVLKIFPHPERVIGLIRMRKNTAGGLNYEDANNFLPVSEIIFREWKKTVLQYDLYDFLDTRIQVEKLPTDYKLRPGNKIQFVFFVTCGGVLPNEKHIIKESTFPSLEHIGKIIKRRECIICKQAIENPIQFIHSFTKKNNP